MPRVGWILGEFGEERDCAQSGAFAMIYVVAQDIECVCFQDGQQLVASGALGDSMFLEMLMLIIRVGGVVVVILFGYN